MPLREWEQKNARSGLYGASGMSATRAVWKLAWHAEKTAASQGVYAQALLDLVKAFESVPQQH